MDSAVNIIIVGPVLVNVMAQAGFPEIQAAIVVIVGFLIGSVTPPVGVAFFTAATIAQVRLEKVAVALIPYLDWTVFTFILYPRYSRIDHVSSKPIK